MGKLVLNHHPIKIEKLIMDVLMYFYMQDMCFYYTAS